VAQLGDDSLDRRHQIAVRNGGRSMRCFGRSWRHSIRLDRSTPITSAAVFIGNRPSVAAAAAATRRQVKSWCKRALGTRAPLAQASRPNQIWVLDFVSDVLETGRRFRVFNVEDPLTRQGLAAEVDTSCRVCRSPARLIGSWPSTAGLR
jgi:hypothetical protein